MGRPRQTPLLTPASSNLLAENPQPTSTFLDVPFDEIKEAINFITDRYFGQVVDDSRIETAINDLRQKHHDE